MISSYNMVVDRRDHVQYRGLYMGGGGVPISYIPLSKVANIPIINFSKYPISLEVNTNIPESLTQNMKKKILMLSACNDL